MGVGGGDVWVAKGRERGESINQKGNNPHKMFCHFCHQKPKVVKTFYFLPVE